MTMISSTSRTTDTTYLQGYGNSLILEVLHLLTDYLNHFVFITAGRYFYSSFNFEFGVNFDIILKQ
jgi:hypothetical protein